MWPQRLGLLPRGQGSLPLPLPMTLLQGNPPPTASGSRHTWMGQLGGTEGRGCHLCGDVEQLKPDCSKRESLFPEWLFRREKTSSKSQPRRPAIARETGVGGQEGLQNSSPGEPPASAKPCRAVAWAPSRVPAWPHGREPRPLVPDVRALLWDRKRHTRTVTVLHGLGSEPLQGGC